MTRQGTWWIVAGIGCLLMAMPAARAEGNGPSGGDEGQAAPLGDEGQRGKDAPRVREGPGPRDRQQGEQGEHHDGDRVQIQVQGGGWVNMAGPRSERPAAGPHGPQSLILVIHLQHISAEAYMQVFKQLCHSPAVGEALGKAPVAMCEQANAIVVLGTAEGQSFFKELAAELDQPSEFHERMHARQMEMRRQEAQMGQHVGPAGGPMGGGMRGGPQGNMQGPPMGGPGRQMPPQGGGPMMGPGRMGMGMGGGMGMGMGMGPMGKGMGMGMGMGMGSGPMGKGPAAVCPKCQGPMGVCPKCQAPTGMCPKCQGGPGTCPMCQGGMDGGIFTQPMPGAMPMPGGPMPGPGGGMMSRETPKPGQPMPGGPVSGGGPTMERPPMSGEGAMMERMRQRRQAEMKGAMPGLPGAGPNEDRKIQATPGGQGQPADRGLDEALMDPGMPLVKRLLSSPLTEKLQLDRVQVEKIEQAAGAYRQNIDHLRDRLAHAMKDADPKDRQAVAQKMIPGTREQIEKFTAELRQRIGEILTGPQRDALERALGAGEGPGGEKPRGEPRREGPPRGEPGQTGPVEAPDAAPGGCGGCGGGGCMMN